MMQILIPLLPIAIRHPGPMACLKQGKTTIAEITDGTSNTIMIGEDAGRDPTYLSPYTEGYYDGNLADIRPTLRLGPAGGFYSGPSSLAVGRTQYLVRGFWPAQ